MWWPRWSFIAQNIHAIQRQLPLPLPSLYGAHDNLSPGHLVHSTYQQALSAQSCTTRSASKSLYGLLGTLTPQIMSFFQYAWNVFVPSSDTAQLSHDTMLCTLQCNYIFRAVNKAHLALSLQASTMWAHMCTDVTSSCTLLYIHYCKFVIFGKGRATDSSPRCGTGILVRFHLPFVLFWVYILNQ